MNKFKLNSILSKEYQRTVFGGTLATKLLNLISQRKKYKDLVAAISNRRVLGRYPVNIQIQTVSTCNATCDFCPYPESWHKDNPGRMSDEVFSKIINEVSQYKIAKLCFYLENEPLLDRKLFDRIEYALSRIEIQTLELATNASLLSKKNRDNIVHLFPSVNNEIWVSFHGIDSSSFESIMGLDFETCKANTLALIEKAQDHNINIRIRGSGMPRIRNNKMPEWFTEEQYITFWNKEFKKHGFKKLPDVGFYYYHNRAGQIERNELGYSKVIRPDLKGFYCARVDQWLHFLYTGELILCCMDYKRNTVFGDIREKNLSDIYNSEKILKLCKQTTGKASSPDNFICKKCTSPGG